VRNIIVILILSLCFTLGLNAQQGWEAGAWLGGMHYFGDLNTDNELTQLGIAGGAFGRYNFNERLALRMGICGGKISGSDANSENNFEIQRNLNFTSNIIDVATQFEFNFLPYVHGSKKQFFSPYLFAGFNVFYYNPQTEFEGTVYDLRPLGTEGQFIAEEYTTVDAGLVYGGGIKYSINYQWSIEVEVSSRKLFTDYIDDVSKTYPEYDDLENLRGDVAVSLSDRSVELLENPIGETGRQRGNSKNNDFYAMLGVSIVYYFGTINCPGITY